MAEDMIAVRGSLAAAIRRCGWCHTGQALADGFCSRMCRVESWKANGDESDFQCEPRIAEALANPNIVLVRTLAQTDRLLRETQAERSLRERAS